MKTNIFYIVALAAGSLSANNGLIIKELKTLAEYTQVKENAIKNNKPTVILFNSSTCTACNVLEKAVRNAAKKFLSVSYYSLDATDKEFKDMAHKEEKVQHYPTTYFLKGTKKIVIDGTRDEEDLDNLLYELTKGKPKPPVVRKAK